MTIQERAAHQMQLAGFSPEEQACFRDILARFFDTFDSGGAVAIASDILARLIAGQPLVPITDDADQWDDMSDCSGEPMWQHRLCSSVFKYADGTVCDVSRRGAVVTFPYLPATTLPQFPMFEVRLRKAGGGQ